jgi:glycosyltransferase involved in cell wall biosynthesis
MEIQKRTIALISETFPPDLCGVADYVDQLSQALSADYDIHVITRAKSGKRSYQRHSVTIHEVMTSKRYIFDVITCLKQLKPDLIDIQLAYSVAANWLNQFNLFSSLNSTLIRLSLKTKLVCTIHELTSFLEDGKSSLPRTLYRRLRDYLNTRLFDYYFCVDRAYLNYFKHDRKLFLPNFSNIPSLVTKTIANSQAILFFGTLAPHKNLDRLISLFTELLALEPRRNLWIVGGQTKEADDVILQQLVAPLPKQSVNYCGRLSGADLEAVLATCSYALFPFPVTDKNASVLATMVNGLVVIAETKVATVFETYGNNFYPTSCLTANFIDHVIGKTWEQPLVYPSSQALLHKHVETRMHVYQTLMS